MEDNPFNKTGPLSDEEAGYVRAFVRRAEAGYVSPSDLAHIVKMRPMLDALEVIMGSGKDLEVRRKKMEALLRNGRVSILTAFADLIVNGKRFTIVVVAAAAFGGAFAVLLRLFPGLASMVGG